MSAAVVVRLPGREVKPRIGAARKPFVWDRAASIGMALPACVYCNGLGLLDPGEPCRCALRKAFRACLNKYRYIIDMQGKSTTSVTCLLEVVGGVRAGERRVSWGRKQEEYLGDFLLVGRRSLKGLDCKIFELHFLLGQNWRTCCQKLKIKRGEFFHAVYRVEQRMGRVFVELRPYPLYPIYEYFSSGRLDLREIEKEAA